MVGRVYVGAHNPLDVVCGAALGVAIAGAVNLALGVRRRRAVAWRRAAEVAAARGHDRAASGQGCRPPSRRRQPLAATALLALPGCGDGQREGGGDHDGSPTT